MERKEERKMKKRNIKRKILMKTMGGGGKPFVSGKASECNTK